MEPETEIAVGKWSAPECPFQIEFSTRVLDDIRLAVVDAFFALPRGGAEIGGILLGRNEGDLISVTGYEALDCEHAMGPSFTLSPRDQSRLEEIIAKAKRNSSNRQPVGWYHSHTRSDISFSEADQDIHQRYFPEPWQIALVLKPHTFEPTRGGFFFRDGDGSIQGSASYQEFVLEPLSARPVPAENAAAPRAQAPITREFPPDGPFGQPEEGEEPGHRLEETDLPRFTQLKPERSRRAVIAVACLAIGLAAGGIGYLTRSSWLPPIVSKLGLLLSKEPDSDFSLSVLDQNGQLNIQWDRNAPAVRNALEATLEITDGSPAPRSIRLDSAHLATGSFSYGRESERVDVALTAREPNGRQVREQTSYLGKLPSQNRDALAEKTEQLQKDLDFQASRTRKLEKDLKGMHDEMQNEKRQRMSNPRKKG